MNAYVNAFVYPLLIVILGSFATIYLSTLVSSTKALSSDSLFRLGSAALFLIICFGAIICFFLDCPWPFGLPTFGLENRPYVIG